MLYFKHSELVNKYHVSLKTVHNWIDAAKQGKLELGLYNKNGRTYIANQPSNVIILRRLAEQGKKYRNARYHKVVSPTTAFYDIFSRRQILGIISNLTIHREIPRQYNYMDGGAHNWDNLLKRLIKEQTPNLLKGTVELVRTNLDSIDLLIQGYKKVNVVDLGVGNAVPVKALLARLLKNEALHRYIAIDISESMLHIAERNIKEWFGNQVQFEGYARDIRYERFDDLLVDDMLASDADQTINLVLLLGATPVNFRFFSDATKVIGSSMGNKDLLVYTDKRDTEATRGFFDFHPNPTDPGANVLSPNHRFMLDLLNIDESLYEVEMGFSEQKRMRYIRIRLKIALSIKFKFGNSERMVELEKGDTILMLRVWHLAVREIISEFEESGFMLLQSSMTKDRQYVMTIFGVDSKSDLDNLP